MGYVFRYIKVNNKLTVGVYATLTTDDKTQQVSKTPIGPRYVENPFTQDAERKVSDRPQTGKIELIDLLPFIGGDGDLSGVSIGAIVENVSTTSLKTGGWYTGVEPGDYRPGLRASERGPGGWMVLGQVSFACREAVSVGYSRQGGPSLILNCTVTGI